MSLNMNTNRHLDQWWLRQLPGLCREPRSRRHIEEFTVRTCMIEMIERRFGTTTDLESNVENRSADKNKAGSGDGCDEGFRTSRLGRIVRLSERNGKVADGLGDARHGYRAI
jgi:hypothetical protein